MGQKTGIGLWCSLSSGSSGWPSGDSEPTKEETANQGEGHLRQAEHDHSDEAYDWGEEALSASLRSPNPTIIQSLWITVDLLIVRNPSLCPSDLTQDRCAVSEEDLPCGQQSALKRSVTTSI